MSDPDAICMDVAGEAIRPELAALGARVGKSQSRNIARAAVLAWLTRRPVEWSKDRSIAHTGTPDAYNVGFAETILPQLADGDFPFEKPVGQWSKADITAFLATAAELMEEQRAHTLERPDTETPL